MSWDQQVLMPPMGSAARGEHLARIATLRHAKFTSDEFKRAVEDARQEADGEMELANVRVVERELRIESAKPPELVQRKLRVGSAAYDAWRTAKPANDFRTMAPYYAELFEIARETSSVLGTAVHPYDNLIDLFEEGSTHAEAVRVFDQIKSATVPLLKRIAERPQVDDSILAHDFDRRRLLQFAREVTTAIGFDMTRGRLDLAANAFCSGTHASDIRMTTRASNHFKGIVSSSLHEMGHGLYEQGIPREWLMMPIADGASMAVHESQSRLWENLVGRSEGPWRYFLPLLANQFSEFSTTDSHTMERMMNKVQAEFIRVGADELTYNLHILVRFELETDLITGALEVRDLPEAWNSKYESYLGIRPPNDTLGVLQDVHWTRGSVGYFPTYTFGNLLSGQIWALSIRELGDQSANFANGDFRTLLDWLRSQIYSKGKLHTPKEVMTRLTGKSLDATDWIQYAMDKFSRIYGL